MIKKIVSLTIFGLILILCSQVYATTYYVANSPGPGGAWSNGSNSNNGMSKASPFLTMSYSFSQMSGGDTLIIADGTYTGSDNMIGAYSGSGRPPQGSTEAYTVIMAENDFGVIINGENSRVPVFIRGDDTNGGVKGDSPSEDYIVIQGIIAKNSSGTNFGVYYANHIKFINCVSIDAADGNNVGFQIMRSSYCLVEGSAAFGNARYKFSSYLSNNSIFRNCVARNDRVNSTGDPMGGFISYSSYNMEFQNCIDIDSDQKNYWLNIAQHQGSFGAPATTAADANGPTNFTNCIAINNNYRWGTSDPNGTYDSKAHYTNCAGAGLVMDDDLPLQGTFGQTWFDKSTFIDVSTESGGAVVNAWVNGWGSANLSSENTIWANFTSSGSIFYDPDLVNNNAMYNINGSTLANNAHGITITSEKTYNPESNGLLHLPRIEEDSQLETDGIGATMMYQYGITGTLYGEPGYATITSTPLWPFPNEDIFKILMQSYSYDSGNLTGNRGFASSTAKQLNGTSDVTLTSYIWEYLGNKMPTDIYGSSSYIEPTHIYKIESQPSAN